MKFFFQWIAVLLLTGICFVPAYLGMHFTNYLEYLALTLICAVAVMVGMRFVHKVAPLKPRISDTYKETK